MEIASRSRGTPRIANRLLRRVRDYAQVRGAGKIDKPTAKAALEMLEVDQYGFDEVDRRLLLTIIEKYQGGPVGVNTLAAVLAEEPDAIEEIYEPFPDADRLPGPHSARPRRHAVGVRTLQNHAHSPAKLAVLIQALAPETADCTALAYRQKIHAGLFSVAESSRYPVESNDSNRG